MWDLLISFENWAIILRNMILKAKGTTKYHIFSSIRTGVKAEFNTVTNNTSRILGSGREIRFWLENWYGQTADDAFDAILIQQALVEFLGITRVIS